MATQYSDRSNTGKVEGCSITQLRRALEEIFKEPIASVIERENTAFDSLLAECDQRCVLFGAGSLGRQALTALKTVGICPVAISDNNPRLWNTDIDGVPLISPVEAAQRYGKDSVFFVVVRNERHYFPDTFRQLKDLGCIHISSADPIAWRFPDAHLSMFLYSSPHKVFEQKELVFRAANLWADDASREEYLAHIKVRTLGDITGLPRPVAHESYFLTPIFDSVPNEVFMDCGSFDGDTIRNLVARQPAFGAIEAVEADDISFAKLEAYVDSLDSNVRERIHLHRCAVGATRGTVRFDNTGTVDARVSSSGSCVVELVPIDELPVSSSVSMIKMDIEGGEVDALLGGRKVIESDRPILAICVYHRQDDLWNIPLLMREMCPTSKMFLKTYGGDGIQTVAYSVPEHRIQTY